MLEDRDRESGVRGQESGVGSQESARAGVRSAKELVVYEKAFALAMQVFDLTKNFPPEERYALTSQIRRSARSVCLNLREAWAKRRYSAHFTSKLTGCDGENSETDSSLDLAHACGYLTAETHHQLTALNHEVGRMLGAMIKTPPPSS